MTIGATQFQRIHTMKVAKLTAFILLIIGTTGLLVNEFVTDWSRGVTITFAILNFVGLATLAFTAWSIKNRDRRVL